MLPLLPPWDWEMVVASTEARRCGTPRATNDVMSSERNWDTRIVPRIARPRLAGVATDGLGYSGGLPVRKL